MTTPAKQKAASLNFFNAIEAFKESTPATRADADKQLDKAIADYRKAYNLHSSFAFSDCIVHFNTNNTL
jgi:hypothetical protein